MWFPEWVRDSSAKAWEHQVATWTLTSGETEAQSKAVQGQVELEGVEADRSWTLVCPQLSLYSSEWHLSPSAREPPQWGDPVTPVVSLPGFTHNMGPSGLKQRRQRKWERRQWGRVEGTAAQSRSQGEKGRRTSCFHMLPACATGTSSVVCGFCLEAHGCAELTMAGEIYHLLSFSPPRSAIKYRNCQVSWVCYISFLCLSL